MLRDAAIAWVRSNCPAPEVHRDFIKSLDATIARHGNCSYLIGRGLTRKAAAYLLYPFAGELFVFQLSARQEAALGIRPMEMQGSPNIAPADVEPAPPPMLSLERLEIQAPVIRDPKQPIVFQCRYSLLRDPGEALNPPPPADPFSPGWAGPWPSSPVYPHLGQGVPAVPGTSWSFPVPPHLRPVAPAYGPVPGQGLPARHGPRFPFQSAGVPGIPDASFPGDFMPGTNYAFRLDHAIEHTRLRSLFTYPRQVLASTGTLTLVFPPPGEDILVAPVLPVFVRCCVIPNPNQGRQATALSSPVGTLLDIEQPVQT
jgi:hypothetical protein